MTGTLDLEFSEDQQAISAAVDRFCAQHDVAAIARQSGQPFPRALWRQLAELGVFHPAAPGQPEAGGALEVCAIAEMLGRHVFPGPIAATYMAVQLLEPEAAAPVMDGLALVSLGDAGSTLLPWGVEADIHLTAGDDGIVLSRPAATIDAVATLGGETWGRGQLETLDVLANSERAQCIGNVATAAYLGGAAWKLLQETSAHAATRRQFGRALGEFQAVSHPLADCAIGLTAAQTLARAAACGFDNADVADAVSTAARVEAAAALLSARRAALATAHACHQVFAGIGITLEGPVFHISRRIRQLASTPPAGSRERDLLLRETGLGE